MGSLIIKPGDTLPALISNQSEKLKVESVDKAAITLVFVEKDGSAGARRIRISSSLKPEVSQFLYGEAVEKVTKSLPKIPLELKSPDVSFTQPVDLLLQSRQALEVKKIDEKAVMGGGQDAKEPEQ
ncbi:MAG: hypothetical protein WCS65_00270 [Verrucomicrobiae bacterium]